MILLPFSTGLDCLILENLRRPMRLAGIVGISVISAPSFPHVLPHPRSEDRDSVFSGIAVLVHFCTGSTTNTKNMNQRFCVVVVLNRQHPREVENAI